VRHLSYANVVATLALFVALGGGAYAIGEAQRNSVTSKSVVNGSLKGIDLLDDSLGGDEVKEEALKGVRSADRADSAAKADSATRAGSASMADVADRADDADRLQGQALQTFMRFNVPIPSGITVTGVWGGREQQAGDLDATPGDDLYRYEQAVSLPFPASVDLTDVMVNYAASNQKAKDFASDDDMSCTGTLAAPTSPPGKVCIYLDDNSLPNVGFNADTASGAALMGSPRLGFYIKGPTATGTDATTSGVSGHLIRGSWAYTAP
jgi:hypothetical protein